MAQHYLLWASGEDRPGIVAAVTKTLFKLGTNLEDSSMMRLGAEFAIFLIFTAPPKTKAADIDAAFETLRRKNGLALGVKTLSGRQAAFRPNAKSSYLVSVHGHDRPGIVYRVTEALARRRFNITDLSTHRTSAGRKAGYILFIEGELGARALAPLRKELARLAREMRTQVSIRPVAGDAL